MKGIILAGGSGTRLYPLTAVTSKQLLPVYDKPMIYYPLSLLMMAGIRDILIISTPQDLSDFTRLLHTGSDYGLNLSYRAQALPEGIAQAFLIGEDFIAGDTCALVLGDNIFYGIDLKEQLIRAAHAVEDNGGATIFGFYVEDPQRYGVVEFDDALNAVSINEKPKNPKSNYAVTGLYFYDKQVCELAKLIKPSKRGELEITTINQMYLEKSSLSVATLGNDYTWFDTGTIDSLYAAGEFIRTIKKNQGLSIAVIEEIAYGNGWIDMDCLLASARKHGKSLYGEYLMKLVGRVAPDKGAEQ